MLVKACTQHRRSLSLKAGERLSCPTSEERLWDSHPRVYLPIAHDGKVVCPYCNIEYVIKEV